jgi:phosphoglycolate phosphatase
VRLAVWDVDGTLVDSRQIIFDCCRYALVQAGLPAPSYDEVRQIVGLSLAPALAVLAPSLTPDQVLQVERDYKHRFREHRAQPGFLEPLYEGAGETLRRLKAEGWRMAIATGKSRPGVDAIVAMHGWADLFYSTHCADDGPGKPDPAMLFEAMRVCGAQADETVMIGDTAHDIRMAHAADVRALGVSWGFNTAAELRAAGAYHVSDNFISLNNQLDDFSNVVAEV